MDLQKIINIFEEHGFNENNCSFFRQEGITDIAKEIEAAINYTQCCTEFADGKCRPMVNADWTYLRCECGKRFEPKG